jgi:SOS-response transcriptional repressor LexA
MSVNFIKWLENNFDSNADAARKIGVSRQTIQDWVSGKSFPRRKDLIDKIKEIGFNDVEYLALSAKKSEGDMLVSGGGGVESGIVVAKGISKRPLRFAPEIGQISTSNYMMPVYEIAVPAGIPIQVFDDIPPSYINMRERYRVQVRGDSMIGVGIEHGDTLEIRLTSQFIDGDIIMARVDDEVTIKRIRNGSGYRLLVPANEDYKPIPLDDNTDWECLGVVEHVMKKAR